MVIILLPGSFCSFIHLAALGLGAALGSLVFY